MRLSTSLLFLFLSLLLPHIQAIQFNEKREYTIVQFTDLHFCGSDETDLQTQELQRNILKWINPDLVVFSGDAVSGWNAKQPGSFEKCWRKFTEPIVEAQVPYAYILGNHDAEGEFDREEIVKFDQKNPFSLRSDCDGIPGTSNFAIPIYSSEDENRLAANIWLFDTGRDMCEDFHLSWGCLKRYVIDWYNEKSQQIKEEHGDNVHHLAFLHIPIPEYLDLANTQGIYGNVGEGIGCPYVNNGFFENVQKNKDISAMFVGHDHKNNFGGFYRGVELVYGQKSGYATYGNERGARVITLKEGYDLEGQPIVTRNHFIMFENGTIGLSEPMRPKEGEKLGSCEYLGNPIAGQLKKIYWNIKKWFLNLL